MSFFLLALEGLIIGGVSAFVYENLPFSKIFGVKKLVIFKLKFHHSLYGPLLILISFIFSENFIFLFSAGIGIIAEHYLTGGGLDFITKE